MERKRRRKDGRGRRGHKQNTNEEIKQEDELKESEEGWWRARVDDSRDDIKKRKWGAKREDEKGGQGRAAGL